MTTSQLASTSWLDDTKADAIFPEHSDITCTIGKGRTIDYFVVSRALVPIILGVDRDLTAAWKPHIGLSLRLSGTPKAVRIRKLFEPAKFDDTLQLSSWHAALQESRELVRTYGPPGQM